MFKHVSYYLGAALEKMQDELHREQSGRAKEEKN